MKVVFSVATFYALVQKKNSVRRHLKEIRLMERHLVKGSNLKNDYIFLIIATNIYPFFFFVGALEY